MLDADALNAFAGDADRLIGRDGVDVIITPHPGEMARLIGLSDRRGAGASARCRARLRGDAPRARRAQGASHDHRDARTARPFINLTGNPGMATGGTGDVLTGMIAALVRRSCSTRKRACKLAVYLHGLAGDLAEADEGEVALIAGDIVARLGDAVLELTGRAQEAAVSVVSAARVTRLGRRRPPRSAATLGRAARRRATSCCSTGRSARARPRSCAAWPRASAAMPTTCRVRRSRSSRNTAAGSRCSTSISTGSQPAEVDDLGLDDLLERSGDGRGVAGALAARAGPARFA